MPSSALQQIVEYRGVEGLVAAKILCDDNSTETNHGYVTDTPFAIAGVAEVSRTTESGQDAHYYDNIPAIVIASNGPDTLTINVSAIPLDVLAYITGQTYDSYTGALVEEVRRTEYFALGYKTKKTNGDEVYVWRYKGTFSIPDQTNQTENAGTDAQGQTLTYVGISTTHKFAKTGKGAKAMNVDLGLDLANVTSFFSAVTTPDSITSKTSYSLTISQAANTTVTVTKNGTALATGATIYAGDALTITVTGGTVTVNSQDFYSGDVHIVTGNTTVASTASA